MQSGEWRPCCALVGGAVVGGPAVPTAASLLALDQFASLSCSVVSRIPRPYSPSRGARGHGAAGRCTAASLVASLGWSSLQDATRMCPLAAGAPAGRSHLVSPVE